MSNTAIRRLCALGGLVYVVLAILGNDVISGAANAPDWTAPPSEIARWLREHPPTTAWYVGGFVEMLGLFAFIVFVAALWTVLREAEGNDSPLPAIALGAGLISAAIKIGSAPPLLEAMTRSKHIDPQLGAALVDMNGFAFTLTFAVDGLLLLAVGVVALRTNVLPRWLAWTAVVLFPLLLLTTAAAPHVPPFAFLLSLLWFAVTGIVLARRRDPELDASAGRRNRVPPDGGGDFATAADAVAGARS